MHRDKLGFLNQTEAELAICAHLRLVRPIAVAIARSTGVEVDELLGAGELAVVTAVREFDPGRGVPLEAWLRFKVRGAMLDLLRRREADAVKGFDAPTHVPSPEVAAIHNEALENSRRALSCLSSRERVVLKLSFVEGFTKQRIAGAIGATPEECWRHRRNAILKLRRFKTRIDGRGLADALAELEV